MVPKNHANFVLKLCCNLLAIGEAGSQNVLGDISGMGVAQTLKNASQLSTKLAQFFDTIFKSKFAVVEGRFALKTSFIFGRGAAQNLKIAAQFNTIF